MMTHLMLCPLCRAEITFATDSDLWRVESHVRFSPHGQRLQLNKVCSFSDSIFNLCFECGCFVVGGRYFDQDGDFHCSVCRLIR